MLAGATTALAVTAGIIGVDRWAPRWDLALLILGFMLGWIPGLVVFVSHVVPHLAQHHDTWDHVLQLVITLVTSVLCAAILRRLRQTSALPRRRAANLIPIAAIAALAALVESARVAPLTWHEWLSEITHVSVGLLLATAVASLPWRRRDASTLWLPVGSLFLAFLVAMLTVGNWDRNDERNLLRIAESTSVGFLTDLAQELNVLTTKADTSATTEFTFETFPELMQTVVFGHEQISAAALVTVDPLSGISRAEAVSDLGPSFEEALQGWILGDGRATLERLAPVGDLIFLGIARIENPVTSRAEPQLVYAAPLRPRGTFDPKAPCYLVGAISMPVMLESSSAQSMTAGSAANVSLVNTTGDSATLVWTSGASNGDDKLSAAPQSGDAENIRAPGRASTSATVADLEITFVAERAGEFGTPLTTRRLLLLVEFLAGFGMFALTLQLSHSRVRREIERQHREALLAAALTGTPGWTAVIDEDDCVVVGNDHPTGATVGSRIDTAAILQHDPAASGRVLDLVRSARGGEPGSITVTAQHDDDADHQFRIYEVAAHAIADSAEDALVFFQCVDVTEKRERAMRTAQSERMESIGVLAGSLAHDFNNLLFITLGYLQMMERQPSVSGDPQLSRFVGRATEAVQRGAAIAKSLLNVARSQPMAAVPVNMRQFMTDLDPLLQQSLAAATQVRLHVEVTADDLDVMADPGRFSSAVLNLVFNARDAMDEGGDLTIRVERVTAENPDGNPVDAVSLSVRDTGRGMSPEVAARAFEPFFTTNKVGKGTGLGLAAVYSFAQQTGGWSTIESREGVGTTVSIFLPPHTADQPLTETAPTARSERLRALVLDDEVALGELVAGWLNDLGFETKTAHNSAQAFEIASTFRPDLLLSDSNLGEDIDGAEVATRMTADLPTLVVVFMTGFSDRLRALDTVGAMTLAKPFSRDDLSTTLIKVLGSRRSSTTPNGGNQQ